MADKDKDEMDAEVRRSTLRPTAHALCAPARARHIMSKATMPCAGSDATARPSSSVSIRHNGMAMMSVYAAACSCPIAVLILC